MHATEDMDSWKLGGQRNTFRTVFNLLLLMISFWVGEGVENFLYDKQVLAFPSKASTSATALTDRGPGKLFACVKNRINVSTKTKISNK